MKFGEAVKTCLSKYATFSGRATRSEYWWFYLFNVLTGIVAVILDAIVGSGDSETGLGIFYLIWLFGLLLPSLAVSVRRYHDCDFRGWWILVPIMNVILLFLAGTKGENRFGPDPLGTEADHVAGGGVQPGGGVSAEGLSRLEYLATLKEKGVLSEEEFATQKAQILGLR